MGYLVRSAGIPNFNKAVISLWFRVPQASIDAARAQYESLDLDNFPDFIWDPTLAGIIPLVTFGPNPAIAIEPYNISPSFIGINCGALNHGQHVAGDTVSLVARIQYATGVGAYTNAGGTLFPDYFQVGYKGKYAPGFSTAVEHISLIEVTPDVWHHVLISFDLSGGCSSALSPGTNTGIAVATDSRFWLAFDDVNKNGTYLWPTNQNCYEMGGGINDIASLGCFNIGSDPLPAAYSFAAGAIPTNGQPIGIPSTAANSSKVYYVDMAPLQFFTGVTVDTSVAVNRRAFIKADGTPENPSVAAAALGQSPKIKLIGSANWKAGTNTGSLGGTLTKTGTINDFTSGPHL